MLGETLRDPEGIERRGETRGLGLLPADTVFTSGKTLCRREAAAEAVADYEYLAILRRLLADHPNRKCEELLKEALDATTNLSK